MHEVHPRNGDRLAQITAALNAWPGFAAVGREGSGAAFLVAQHDIAAPDLMRGNRDLLRQAVSAGDADPAGLAYLEDRVRAFEGRLQVYGTQLGWADDGGFGVWPPIEHPEAVDERRAQLGLPPLEPHVTAARAGIPIAERSRSADERARQRREEAEFARSVGWR